MRLMATGGRLSHAGTFGASGLPAEQAGSRLHDGDRQASGDDTGDVYGFNRGSTEWLVGPGYFVSHGTSDEKDPPNSPDRSFNPSQNAEIWLKQGDVDIYTSQAEAQGFVTIRYHRPDGDYGDYTSANFNDFWGMHAWGDITNSVRNSARPTSPAADSSGAP